MKASDSNLPISVVRTSGDTGFTYTFNNYGSGWESTVGGALLKAPLTGTATITWTVSTTGTTSPKYNLYDTTAKKYAGAESSGNGAKSFTIELEEGHEYSPRWNASSASSTVQYTRSTPVTITYNLELPKNPDTYKGKADDIHGLGDNCYMTIFGLYNGEFFAGMETTEATTGNITPGNFVGYLQIGDYKIPYYL